jgi:GAF domain-containing protein
MQLLQEVQQDGGMGPSVSAYTDDRVVVADDLGTEARWDRLAALVRQVSVRSVLSVPIRLDGRAVGTLDVYVARPGSWSSETVTAAEAFAGVAGDLLMGSIERRQLRREVAQLQHALTARILVEQAKGVLVGTQGLTPEAAFERLRAEARSSRRKMADLALEVVQRAQRERLAARAANDAVVRPGDTQARYTELAMAELEARQARAAAAWNARSARADERDRAADARDQTADARDKAADQRDRMAERDRIGDERDRAADARDESTDPSR